MTSLSSLQFDISEKMSLFDGSEQVFLTCSSFYIELVQTVTFQVGCCVIYQDALCNVDGKLWQ